MEFGPRALGSRSIIADPRSEKMQKQMNLLIKYRENFIRKYEELLLLNFDESFGGFGPSAGGISFEPVEITKFILIALLAKYFSSRHVDFGLFRHIIIYELRNKRNTKVL